MQFNQIRQVAAKELTLFFSSPVGYLFLAAFLAVTLFVVFWVETYFSRNIADVRPMFEWMPLLLVFLASTLTMRMWSEERRAGTIEFVLTCGVSHAENVFGKFFACWLLLGLALLLTLPLPLTVASFANLDWGPVWAGYLAALLLGGAYIAVGLFISARTDSQIVSLMLSVVICGGLYLLGSGWLTDFLGANLGAALQTLGTGTHFESITRGVLDLGDLYYYLSLTGVFLALNIYSLESARWAADGSSTHHQAWRIGTGLLVANLVLGNLWISQLGGARIDMTQGKQYSLSPVTKGYLDQLQEPLLIRGYFSAKTHPLLAPLVPRMRDLLAEYEQMGEGKLRLELIDPAQDPAAEDEANSKYGIRAVPFPVADRHQTSLVNSYFDVLISYGDQYEVLSFRDLIEVKVQGEDDIDVQLRNPEYDITRSIKQVLYGFQGGSSLFSNIQTPVEFVGYVSAVDRLPEQLRELQPVIESALEKLVAESNGKLAESFVDPAADGGAVGAQIAADYGFQPMAMSLFDNSSFYYYLTLRDDKTLVQVPLPEALSEEAVTRGLTEGLKRFATGLLKTVALSTPAATPPMPGMMGQMQPPAGNQYNQLRDFLQSDMSLEPVTLSDGVVPQSADVLVVVDPTALDEKQIFAIDQFLMRGGTVVLATSPFAASLSAQSISVVPRQSGLSEWLEQYGVTMPSQLVMDPQNSAFPVPVTRQAGGFSFQDMAMLDYPYFMDIRPPGLNPDNAITAALPQLTMSWATPIDVAADKNQGREVVELLASSAQSWLSSDTNVIPRFDEQGNSGFVPGAERGQYLVGVMLEGQFESFFKGKSSPLLAQSPDTEPADNSAGEAEDSDQSLGTVSSVIEKSPESARLVVFSSNDFLADQVTRMIGSANGTLYTGSTQLMANVVDYALEDQSLLSIRSRGQFNRTLPPLPESEKTQIEYLNYGLAVFGVGLVWLWRRIRSGQKRKHYASWLAAEGARA